MNEEAALLAAIVANPDEDTPRLVYADWLEEHDAPIQAEFIRVQCRLASGSAADEDYPDLLEQYAEVAARFQAMVKLTAPTLPPGFTFSNHLGLNADNFRRGFLHSVHGSWVETYNAPEDEQIEEVCNGLQALVSTTTARHLDLLNVNRDQLARILAAPGAEAITGLDVTLNEWTEEGDAAMVTAVTQAKCARNLRALSFITHGTTAGLAPFAAAKFERLTHLGLPVFTGPARPLRPLTEAKWFRELQSIRARGGEVAVETLLLAAFAKMPRLESLELNFYHDEGKKALASVRGFPVLARLTGLTFGDDAGVAAFAKGRFPKLAELELHLYRGSHLTTLLKSRWFPQLRVLSLGAGRLTNSSVAALSKVAANLRILQIEDNSLGQTAFAALVNGSRFPNLTTLEITLEHVSKLNPADMVALVEKLNHPQLRHLNLSGWPLGDAGAKALAANPAMSNLTRLSLAGCGIGEAGFTALVRSPRLQQLIELDVRNNKLKTAAALRKTKYLPRLAAARLSGNVLPLTAWHRLSVARGLAV